MEDSIRNALLLAAEYYPKKKMAHAIRVAEHAYQMALLNHFIMEDREGDVDDFYALGILHDLIEDTDCSEIEVAAMGFGPDMLTALDLLTKRDTEDYTEYIDRILQSDNELAYIVKKADMKDHLTLTDTLTDKLRDKYLPVIHHFI